MEKIVAKDTVKVFSFPECPKRIEIAIKSIDGLTKKLRSCKYKIDLSISFENVHEQYPDFSDFLRRFYETCKRLKIFSTPDGDPFALRMLDYFWPIIRDPGTNVRNNLPLYMSPEKEEFVQPFVDEARSHSEEWRPAIGLQVHMLEDPCLLGLLGSGGWGVAPIAKACEDCRIALVIKEYPQIIYHEFLHLFGVGEGYDKTTKATLPEPDCDKSCWMQYEVSKGTGLCQNHQDELRDFLKRMKGKEIE